MTSEAQKRATQRYQKDKVKQQLVKFYPSDADVYEFLQRQENKAGYIKALIRADMERRGE